MAAPSTPTLLRPAEGELVVQTLPVFLAKSAFADTDAGVVSNEIKAATTDDGGDWTDAAYLRTGSGLQNTMATATALGKSQILSWSGVSFSGTSTNRVKDVLLRVRAMATWSAAPGIPGNTEVRATLSYAQVRKQFVLGMLCRSQQWVGGSTPVPADGLFVTSIDSWLRTVLGAKYTLADLASAGANLRVLISTWAGLDHYVTAWKAGPVQLSVDYWSTEPSRQFAYQFDVGEDSGFSSLNYSTGQNNVEHDTHTVGANLLNTDDTLYGRVRQNDGTSWSSWSATNSFTTLSAGASRLISEVTAQGFLLFEIEAARWLDAGAWSKTSGRTYTYQATLARGSELTPNWWIVDIEEEGIRQGYSAVATVALVDATAETYYHDEAAGIIYVRTSDGRNPGAFKGAGIGLLVAVPVAVGWVGGAGPGDVWTYEGRILGSLPEIQESIDDLASGVGASASGSLELSNWDNLFDKLLGDRDPVLETGLQVNGRRVVAKMIGTTSLGVVPYAQALEVWRGLVRWAPDAHQRKAIRLNLSPRDLFAPDASLAERRYSQQQYPNVHKTWDGRAIQEVIGLGHIDLDVAVVDTVNRVLRPGLAVSTVRTLRLDGVPVPAANWSYSSTTNHISILSGGASTWAADKDKRWTCDCDGVSWESSAAMKPGKLARYLMDRGGIPASEINTASFNWIDSTWAPHELRFVAADDMQLRDALLTTLRSGRFFAVFRFDGDIEAVPDTITTPYATTPVFGDGDLLEDPVTVEEQDAMGSWVEIDYWGYPELGTTKSKYAAGTWLAKPWHQREGTRKVETYHATLAGAMFTSLGLPLNVPFRHVRVRTTRKGLAAGVGKSVVLELSEARDPKGYYRHDLFQVRRRSLLPDGTVSLELRWIRTLGGFEGPF